MLLLTRLLYSSTYHRTTATPALTIHTHSKHTRHNSPQNRWQHHCQLGRLTSNSGGKQKAQHTAHNLVAQGNAVCLLAANKHYTTQLRSTTCHAVGHCGHRCTGKNTTPALPDSGDSGATTATQQRPHSISPRAKPPAPQINSTLVYNNTAAVTAATQPRGRLTPCGVGKARRHAPSRNLHAHLSLALLAACRHVSGVREEGCEGVEGTGVQEMAGKSRESAFRAAEKSNHQTIQAHRPCFSTCVVYDTD